MRILAVLFVAALFSASAAVAQTLVSTIPSNRNVVLEEFTGVRCGYCPEGHAIGQGIHDKFPERTVLINIHSGDFATPVSGYPDFTTQFGEAIDQNAGVGGYPAATLNRRKFNGGATQALNRDRWVAAAEEVRAMPSPVNVGVKSTFDAATRNLTVTVEAYYTADSPVAENVVQVALLESKVIGYQSDYAKGSHKDYSHSHMLRWMLTGQWGEAIAPVKKGSLITKTFTYTVPETFNIENCDVAAYVSETGRQDIYTGEVVAANGGTTQKIVELTTTMGEFWSGAKDKSQTCLLKTQNLADAPQMTRIHVETNAPADWNITGTARGEQFTTTKAAEFNMEGNSIAEVQMNITPGATAAVASITVWFESVTTPNARKKSTTFYVISGVKDLIVSHSDAVKFDAKYSGGLNTTGKTGIGVTTQDVFTQLSRNNALAGVKNLYFNVSWSFPGVTDALVAEIAKAMNGGMNAMFAGQDLGWDIASADSSAHGTAAQREFYTKYLHAKFISDGTPANASISAIPADAIFGTTPNFTVLDVFGTGTTLYPDYIEPVGIGRPIFMYNNDATKIGAVRAETGVYKMVYLGFGIEQINNPVTANGIVKATSDWFEGLINGVEFEQEMSRLTASPNPASESVTFNVPTGAANLTIWNPQGILLRQFNTTGSTITAPVSEYAAGTYCFSFGDAAGTIIARGVFTVVK